MTANASSDELPRPPRWPWLLFGAALAWSVVLRTPLILNARAHLDSDLAVDGLTLLEAVQGQWRWHYPGTPHIATIPVLLSWPQAIVFGANPATLVSGGAVAFGALMLATFLLAWRAFGPQVASWSLLPLAFASTGTIWLSGRITGGHLLVATWHAGAFALLFASLARGGSGRAIALGLWCGLGLYLDSMFLVTLAGLVPAAVLGGWPAAWSRRGLAQAGVFLLAFLVGAAPRAIGARVEPYDAYQEQFQPLLDRDVLVEHARLLALDCLPRLVAGHRLPDLEADPDPAALANPSPVRPRPESRPIAWATTLVSLALFGAAQLALIVAAVVTRDAPRRALCVGLLVSSAAIAVGFILNRNIFNSDNYRYLVDWLVPWSIGFGLLMRWLSRRGEGGIAVAAVTGLVLATLMTLDAGQWYAGLGWIDTRGLPVRQPLDDPALGWLEAHPEVHDLLGDYWDVYRLSFLSGGRLRGMPYWGYPNRFPEWTKTLPKSRPGTMIVRPTARGRRFRKLVLDDGGRVAFRGRGFEVLRWP